MLLHVVFTIHGMWPATATRPTIQKTNIHTLIGNLIKNMTDQANEQSDLKIYPLKLSDSQWRTLGNYQDGIKILQQKKRKFKCIKLILSNYIILSNGGRIPTEISQAKLRETVMDGKLLQPHMVSDSIKFLRDAYNFIVVDIPHKFNSKEQHKLNKMNANATFYVGGKDLFDLLDPDAKRKKPKKKRLPKMESRKKDHTDRGFNPQHHATCQGCFEIRELIDFNISKENNSLQPVCQHCYANDQEFAKSASKPFYKKGCAMLIHEHQPGYVAMKDESKINVDGVNPRLNSPQFDKADIAELLEGL